MRQMSVLGCLYTSPISEFLSIPAAWNTHIQDLKLCSALVPQTSTSNMNSHSGQVEVSPLHPSPAPQCQLHSLYALTPRGVEASVRPVSPSCSLHNRVQRVFREKEGCKTSSVRKLRPNFSSGITVSSVKFNLKFSHWMMCLVFWSPALPNLLNFTLTWVERGSLDDT